MIRVAPNQGVVRHLSQPSLHPSLQTSGVNVMVATELPEPVHNENGQAMYLAPSRAPSRAGSIPRTASSHRRQSQSPERQRRLSARESSTTIARENSQTSLRQAWESEIQRSQRRSSGSSGREASTSRRALRPTSVPPTSPVRKARERPVSVSTNEALGNTMSPDTGDYIRQATEVAETILRSETPATAHAVEQKLRYHSDGKAKINGVHRGNTYVSPAVYKEVVNEEEASYILQKPERVQGLKTEVQPVGGEVKRVARAVSRHLVK